MIKVIKKLTDLLPVSRRKYKEALQNITTVMNGLIESDANHCQIEVGLVQEMQKNRATNAKKPVSAKKGANGNDVAFM